jgi:polyhydroxyalkanoate synthesis repressor PhaR
MPLIKRYANRKLYDTEAKRYITLDGIAELIRREQEVKVIDHETGEDITAVTQAQIIFEQERKIKGGLPRVLLTNLIQTSNATLSQIRHAVFTPVEWQAEVDAEIERRVQLLIQNGKLSDDDGLHILDVLLAPIESAEPQLVAPSISELRQAIKSRAIPTRADLAQLTRQIEALTAEVDHLAKPQAAHTRKK